MARDDDYIGLRRFSCSLLCVSAFFFVALCVIVLGEFTIFFLQERKKWENFKLRITKNIAHKRDKTTNTMTTTLLTACSSLVSTRVQQQQQRKQKKSNNNNKNKVTIIKALGGFGPEIKPEEIRRIQEERRKKIEQAKRDAEARKNNKNGISAKNNKNAKAKDEKPKKFFGLFWEKREREKSCSSSSSLCMHVISLSLSTWHRAFLSLLV